MDIIEEFRTMADEQTYLMKHAGSCTGMYWRRDPRTAGGSFSSPPDWPRNGAILKGKVLNVPSKPEDCEKWLEVTEYKQAGTDAWVKTPGCFMQFDQHGPLLHEHNK